MTTPTAPQQPFDLTIPDTAAAALRLLADQLLIIAGWWDVSGAHLWLGHCIHYTFKTLQHATYAVRYAHMDPLSAALQRMTDAITICLSAWRRGGPARASRQAYTRQTILQDRARRFLGPPPPELHIGVCPRNAAPRRGIYQGSTFNHAALRLRYLATTSATAPGRLQTPGGTNLPRNLVRRANSTDSNSSVVDHWQAGLDHDPIEDPDPDASGSHEPPHSAAATRRCGCLICLIVVTYAVMAAIPYQDQIDGYLPTPSRDPSYRQRRRREAATPGSPSATQPRRTIAYDALPALWGALKWTAAKLGDMASGGASAIGSGLWHVMQWASGKLGALATGGMVVGLLLVGAKLLAQGAVGHVGARICACVLDSPTALWCLRCCQPIRSPRDEAPQTHLLPSTDDIESQHVHALRHPLLREHYAAAVAAAVAEVTTASTAAIVEVTAAVSRASSVTPRSPSPSPRDGPAGDEAAGSPSTPAAAADQATDAEAHEARERTLDGDGVHGAPDGNTEASNDSGSSSDTDTQPPRPVSYTHLTLPTIRSV